MSNLGDHHVNWLGFGWAFVPTDIENPLEPGEPLCAFVKIAPRWYWFLRRLRLFFLLLRRGQDMWSLDWRTAWEVSQVAIGPSGPKSRRQ